MFLPVPTTILLKSSATASTGVLSLPKLEISMYDAESNTSPKTSVTNNCVGYLSTLPPYNLFPALVRNKVSAIRYLLYRFVELKKHLSNCRIFPLSYYR